MPHAPVRGRYQIPLRPVTGLPFVGLSSWADNSRTDARRTLAGAVSADAYEKGSAATYERKYERWEQVVEKANEEFTVRGARLLKWI